LPDIAIFILMVLATLILDEVLHIAGRPALGRYLGYIGTGLLIVSFTYSARKRKLIEWGKPATHLRVHEFLTWLGAVLILVHGGVHFNALLPWLAIGAMLIAVASGLTGKFLFKRSRGIVTARRAQLKNDGHSTAEVAEQLYWDILLVDLMKQWRIVHLPITILFAFLALLHILSVLLFWRW